MCNNRIESNTRYIRKKNSNCGFLSKWHRELSTKMVLLYWYIPWELGIPPFPPFLWPKWPLDIKASFPLNVNIHVCCRYYKVMYVSFTHVFRSLYVWWCKFRSFLSLREERCLKSTWFPSKFKLSLFATVKWVNANFCILKSASLII